MKSSLEQESRRSGGFFHVPVRVIKAPQTSSERGRIEIHQESRRTSGELQISNHLREVDRMYAFNDFQLHDEAAFDQKVQFQHAADALAFVLDGNTPLALDTKVFAPHLDDHAIPVHGFQQSGREGAVDLDGAAYDSLSQRFDFWNRGTRVRCGSTMRAGCCSEAFAADTSEVGSICHGARRMAFEKPPAQRLLIS